MIGPSRLSATGEWTRPILSPVTIAPEYLVGREGLGRVCRGRGDFLFLGLVVVRDARGPELRR